MLHLMTTHISHRVSLAMILVVAAIILGFAGALIIEQRQNLERELTNRVAIIAQLSQKTLPLPMWNVDNQTLNDFIVALLTDPAIVYAEYQIKGNLAFTTGTGRQTRAEFAGRSWQFFESTPQFWAQRVMIVSQDTELGFLRFAVSKATIQADLRRWLLTISLETLVVILAIALTAFVITNRTILRPLYALQMSAKRLAQGQLEEPIDVSRRDELGHLAQSFANMRDAIRGKMMDLQRVNEELSEEITERKHIEAELQRHREHLEDVVRVRTAELTTANEQLLSEIAERKHIEGQLKESEELFSTFMDYLPTAVFIKDTESRTVYVNRYFEQRWGRDVIGKTIFDLYPEALARNMLADDQLALTQGKQERIERVPLRTGEERIFQTSKFRIDRSGKPPRIGGFALDITANKQAEAELQRAKEAAEAANRAKSVFLANMSHELRTPLTAILGFAQIVARNPGIPPKDQENLSIIQRSGEHLLTLINQVLDLSKIEAGKITLNETAFNLHCLLDDLNKMFTMKAQKKALQIIFERLENVPQYVRTDEVKLREVLLNVLGNAIKFTQAGSATLRVSSIGNCQLHFEIEDTGPGIAPEEKAHLFEAFVQTETGRQTQEGTGLGLTISQKFVQLMGGDISVSSEFGRGSTFRFNIQVMPVPDADIAEEYQIPRVLAVAPGQPRYRLLVVDDVPNNRALLVKLLTPYGFDLREASNGQEAIDLWWQWQPHLIWMDLRMPVMDGYQTTQRIRNEEFGMSNETLAETPDTNHPTPRTVIIALSASSFEEERSVALSNECDDFLRKPFRETDIVDLLHKHLGVQFIYEEGERPFAPSTSSGYRFAQDRLQVQDKRQKAEEVLTPEALAAFSEDVRAELQQAVDTLDIGLFNDLIGRIRRQNEPLADALAELGGNYRFDVLQKVLQSNA